MADADNKEDTSDKAGKGPDLSGLKTDIDAKLAEVNDQIASMNQQFVTGMKAITDAVKPKKDEVDDDDAAYEPAKFRQKVLSEASSIFDKKLKEEQSKNATVYNLAQEYPEIQTNADVRKAVLEAQKTLPEEIRDTALGYETAVLRAVSKQGLVPKSKRDANLDPDIAAGGGRGTGTGQRDKKVKVSENTLAIAQLLGRDITDKNVLKGLEEAAQRTTYTRYK